ncbi:MAG: endopeptidase La [Deltaproteobacteria bacterium]|nr:endopeptidase La [Deltaproteobacteria bacterium]MBW2075505.1 endopeptidase La [Deltaproteobacteria bacterium]RLB82096.1 MAG: endopeptidase La [Deltaproteobacteria bacterium]
MAQINGLDTVDIIHEDGEAIDIPDILPLLPLRDVVVFTYMIIPLFVGRDKSVRAVDAAMAKDRLLLLSTQSNPTVENPKPGDIYRVGTVAMILRMLKLPDGRVKVLVQGLGKARVVNYTKTEPFYQVRIEEIPEQEVENISVEAEALMRNVCEESEKILELRGELTGDVSAILRGIDEPGRLADLVASNLRLKVEQAQGLLEINDPFQKLQRVNELLGKELEVSAMQAKIQSDAREEISKTQREYFLREQMRAIHKELGDIDEKAQEVSEYTKKIKKAKMSKEAEKEAFKQLKRLEQMHPDAAEASIVRTYLDWLVEVPWRKSTKEVLDIKKAHEVLDEDHYDLKKVKERILEYLSVRKLNKHMKGPILCFVGPPGVGKTSLGRSIAKAMNRKFFRISLGGIRDEAEIRGHRRTYIGAMPGRIIQGLKQCGTNNPVFMMDEVDKIGADFRGDPAAALLEALDPEQNVSFSDHYLNLPFDLSKVMFITTANLVDPILSALRDRMEIIELAGYTEEEKLAIAQQFLVPRQIKENGIKSKHLGISQEALRKIISQYTFEAGVRNLEREIGTICRKVARKVAEGEKGPFKVTSANLHRYLGVPKYLPELEQKSHEIGVATGLAWTQAGGEVLYVEASTMKGKGDLTLTGQLGEVMQESAKAALTYARSFAKTLGIKNNFYQDLDIHIHVPAGAIPKDGPSAGAAIVTALVSTLSGRPVNRDVAMTGEITLRGRILPVGGLKEKALAALRADVRKIIIPEKNKKDLAEIPSNIKRKLAFLPVSHMDEALKIALNPKPARKRTRKSR